MKIVKYKIGEKEMISFLPEGAIILNARIIFKCECGSLLYLPKRLKWEFDSEIFTERASPGETGSLSFALYNSNTGCWEKHPDDYLNITLKQYEK